MIAALALVAACGTTGPATPTAWRASGDLVLHGRGLGVATVERAGATTTWTIVAPDGRRTWSHEADAAGRLARWSDDGGDDPRAVALAHVDGRWSWSAHTFGGAGAVGTFVLPRAPMWLPAGGPALRAWALGATEPIWDGEAARDGTLVARTETVTGLDLVVTAGADTWTVTLGPGDVPLAVGWPDATTWRAGVDATGPTLRASDLVDPTDPLPDRLRELVVRLPDATVLTVTTPLWAEVPAELAAPAPADPRAIPTVLPVDLPLPPAADDRATLRAAFDAVVRGRTDGDDCKALAWRLAGALHAHDIAADVVLGLVYTDDGAPRFVRHAWVRVPFAGGAVDVDPALGQLVADATHLSGPAIDALPPGAPIAIVAATGPGGRIAVPHDPGE